MFKLHKGYILPVIFCNFTNLLSLFHSFVCGTYRPVYNVRIGTYEDCVIRILIIPKNKFKKKPWACLALSTVHCILYLSWISCFFERTVLKNVYLELLIKEISFRRPKCASITLQNMKKKTLDKKIIISDRKNKLAIYQENWQGKAEVLRSKLLK